MYAGQTRRAVFAAGFALTAAAASDAAAQSAEAAGPGPRSDLYAVLYRSGPAWRAGRPMQDQDLKGHVAYMQKLADAGVLLAAGPLTSLDGGLIVLNAPSRGGPSYDAPGSRGRGGRILRRGQRLAAGVRPGPPLPDADVRSCRWADG